MASKGQFTRMTGLYLLAAELAKRQMIVSPTSRSVQTADLLVTDANCRRAYAVQVKTNARTFSFWLVGAKTDSIKSDSLIYAFINLRPTGPEFYLVPSRHVARVVDVARPTRTRKTTWYFVYRDDIKKFKDNWKVFDK
jgi:hypothetical protein